MIDIDDEDAVLAEMAEELGEDAEDLSIESDKGLESFGVGTAWRVSSGRREWVVVQDDDVARDLAVEIVKQDLDSEPEIFNRSFLESHINIDRLRRDLRYDLMNSTIDDLSYEAESDPEEFWERADAEGMDVPEEDLDDEDWEWPTPEQPVIEDLAERIVDAQLEDPMQYLEDIYGREDAVKQAIEIAGIDIEAAAEDAVSADGAGHFVSSYDGEIYDTPEGLCYWRTQ